MRLIDADAVDDVIQTLNENGWCVTRSEHKRIDRVLFEIPTVDAVKHGHWISDYPRIKDQCSICKMSVNWAQYKTPYCPNCGAKMDEGGEDAE